MNTWLAWMAAYAVTGNPIVALALAAVVAYSGNAWWSGRLWRPWAFVQRWLTIRDLGNLLEANPHDATARSDLGRMLVERGRYAEALPHLEKAHARVPNVAGPAWHLGVARLNTGDLEGGREAIEKALTIRKDIGYGEPQARLGDAYAKAGRWGEALEAYERAIAVHTSSAEFEYKAALARRATGDIAGAKRSFEEAIRIWRSAPGFKAPKDQVWALRAWWAKRSL